MFFRWEVGVENKATCEETQTKRQGGWDFKIHNVLHSSVACQTKEQCHSSYQLCSFKSPGKTEFSEQKRENTSWKSQTQKNNPRGLLSLDLALIHLSVGILCECMCRCVYVNTCVSMHTQCVHECIKKKFWCWITSQWLLTLFSAMFFFSFFHWSSLTNWLLWLNYTSLKSSNFLLQYKCIPPGQLYL